MAAHSERNGGLHTERNGGLHIRFGRGAFGKGVSLRSSKGAYRQGRSLESDLILSALPIGPPCRSECDGLPAGRPPWRSSTRGPPCRTCDLICLANRPLAAANATASLPADLPGAAVREGRHVTLDVDRNGGFRFAPAGRPIGRVAFALLQQVGLSAGQIKRRILDQRVLSLLADRPSCRSEARPAMSNGPLPKRYAKAAISDPERP
jgi:hypothetical protein